MGPRLLGRGNQSTGDDAQYIKIDFNGAASVGTRKWRGMASPRRRYRHFNGAASVGTRKSDRRRVADDRMLRTSMGPRLLGRGNRAQKLSTRWPPKRLQWGRVCWDAEITLYAEGFGLSYR